MNSRPFSRFKTWALASAATMVLAGPALAEDARRFEIPQQSLVAALEAFGRQGDKEIIFSRAVAEGRATGGVVGDYEPAQALTMLLEGSGLRYRQINANTYVVEAAGPQSGSAAGDGAEVEVLIVTAQKKEEDIQDVPIAISAFSQQALEAQKIEGGFDLLKAIPNVSFSKNNFSGYNFSIRGIGTKAISVATDPGVAVEFNGSPLIRNRLFEQEYFDVERVEVLRGPQGTLHGRNATAGVINVISQPARLDAFSGGIKGEIGNYNTKRLSGFVNVPLAEDVLGVRLAGALTSRDGYDYNATTKNAVNGRDLWSARLSVGFAPTETLRADLIWERFEEDDDRSRTGKQLCHHDAGLTEVGAQTELNIVARGSLSQGCKDGSLYDDNAFGTPNGISIPFVLGNLNNSIQAGCLTPDCYIYVGTASIPVPTGLFRQVDPYGGMMQSRDLRVINSIKDPEYRANTDVIELNVSYDITESLTFTSQTVYSRDKLYSFQDYNRFNTQPLFIDTTKLYDGDAFTGGPSNLADLAPGGVYCDPQLGCSNSFVSFDISQAKSTQFAQEFRIASDFDGPFNFSGGVNYIRYRTIEDYYVLSNLITASAQAKGFGGLALNRSVDPTKCRALPFQSEAPPATLVDIGGPGSKGCIYIDTNPVESINGEGHNYFRSKNPYTLKSGGIFAEGYWEFRNDLKLTMGVRYSDDRKVFTPVPSQALLSSTPFLGGFVDRGYPELANIKQHWGEWSGRIGFDWKPNLGFTDDTLVYAFYSRGYKAGGANPPGIGYSPTHPLVPSLPPLFQPLSYPKTFEPEFVNAYEIGTKNSLLGGALIFNGNLFLYDYTGYQVSQIKERTAVNENFDAKVWGAELESVWHPRPNLRLNLALGYQDSELAQGSQSIDLMDRLQGNTDDYLLLKPYVTMASNCVVAKWVVEEAIALGRDYPDFAAFLAQYPEAAATAEANQMPYICRGTLWNGPFDGKLSRPLTDADFPNQGQGFYADVSGNELPNAPHWTQSFGVQYNTPIFGTWEATIRGDVYHQSQSWARIYQDRIDKLHGWYNVNLSLWLENDSGLKVELYAKNLLDQTPITDAFLNSDDSALTTNIFVLDPRLIGLSIRQDF